MKILFDVMGFLSNMRTLQVVTSLTLNRLVHLEKQSVLHKKYTQMMLRVCSTQKVSYQTFLGPIQKRYGSKRTKEIMKICLPIRISFRYDSLWILHPRLAYVMCYQIGRTTSGSDGTTTCVSRTSINITAYTYCLCVKLL